MPTALLNVCYDNLFHVGFAVFQPNRNKKFFTPRNLNFLSIFSPKTVTATLNAERLHKNVTPIIEL